MPAVGKALFGPASEAFSGKVGDHETWVLPFVEDLGFAHHPARAAPTLARAILKPSKRRQGTGPLRFLSPCKASEAFAQAGAQPLVARQSKAVIDPVLLAQRHNLLAGEPTVGPHNNAHPGPKRFRMGKLIFLIASTVPLLASRLASRSCATERDLAAKAVKGQVTIVPVITVEESSLLVDMQRVVSGIKIQDDSRLFRGIAFTPSSINKAPISWGLAMIFL